VFGVGLGACGGGDESVFNDGNDGGVGGDIDTGFDPTTNDSGFAGDSDLVSDTGLSACATESARGKLLPLDLFMMLDTSGSMYGRVTATQSKYVAVKGALTTFVNDPASAGIGLGLSFFPATKAGEPATCTQINGQCNQGAQDFCGLKVCTQGTNFYCKDDGGCNGGGVCVNYGTCANDPSTYCNPGLPCGNGPAPDNFPLGNCSAVVTSSTCTDAVSCNVADYATPVVPITALPGGAAAFVGALNAKSPNGNTPTSAALQGAINSAKAFATANPGHTAVAILATDGIPTQCDTNIANIKAIAAAGVAGTPSVKTYVIGVFATAEQAVAKPNLDQIAQGGGTTAAQIVTANATAAAAFTQAMNTIRGTALPCEFVLPVPEAGTPDYAKVNVQYTATSGGAQVFPYGASAAGCDPTKGGWYYDKDPAAGGKPTKVTLCPASCTVVKGDPTGKIDIVQGCKTVGPGIK
jgi:Mg-chelatase subunit ChlD